jgi:GWxTD domain-containing protein
MPEGPVRASGSIGIAWNVYVPDGAESPRGAFALLNSATEVVREGWFEGAANDDGVVSFSADVLLNGLPKGRYRITAAALNGDELVASASSSVSLLESWDIWGDDPEVTSTLIRPIASASELRELSRAGGQGDRNSVMADFWNRRDPNPATRANEYLQEYLRRLDHIAREFTTTGVQGINTDRGIVYAKMGEPDITASYPFEVGDYPYITWEYFTPSLSVTFVDQAGYGFYELVEDWETVNRAFNAGEDWSQL